MSPFSFIATSGVCLFRPRIIVQGDGFSHVLHDKKDEYLKGIKESVRAGYEILKVVFHLIRDARLCTSCYSWFCMGQLKVETHISNLFWPHWPSEMGRKLAKFGDFLACKLSLFSGLTFKKHSLLKTHWAIFQIILAKLTFEFSRLFLRSERKKLVKGRQHANRKWVKNKI